MKKIIFGFSLSTALSALAVPVTDVKVKALDGYGGDLGAVASRCQTKVGAEYDPVLLTRDVNSLKATKEFEEISVDKNTLPDGVEVVFYVRRKVRFSPPLVVEGCDFFSESRIRKESELKDGFLYGEADRSGRGGRQGTSRLSEKVFPRREGDAEGHAVLGQ